MALSWNPASLPGLAALITGASMAALVLWTRPGRPQNRRLALLLALEGITFGALGGLLGLVGTVDMAGGTLAVMLVTILLLPWAYLAFLATLDSPWVAWLDNRLATVVLVVGAGASVASYLVYPDLFVEHIIQHAVVGGYDWVGGPLAPLAFLGLLLAALFGLLVAISVYRRTTQGSARRSAARAYLAAFGVRDTLQGASLVYIITVQPTGGSTTLLDVAMGVWLPQVAFVLFSLLLAYGILKTQLFDIDLKIKWGIRRSTVAAIFISVFFVAGELAETFFGEIFGTYAGIIAAGVLVFFLAPLHRFADKVGDVAMPGVEDTDAYRQRQKTAIYRASLEELLADGEITAKERRMLGRLQEELGIAAGQASQIEADVVEGRGGEPA